MNNAPPELLLFALADHAFREADALAELLIGLAPPSDSHLFAACTTGIVTSYCRPFMSSYGLGKLPPNMAQFPEKKIQLIHDTVIETRHKLAAHFDRNHSEERFKNGTLHLPPSEVRVDLRMNGFVVSSNAAYLNPGLVQSVRTLCAYQMKRVSDRLGAFATEIHKKEKRMGEFVFTVE
jgi:hypothetical protein